MERRSTPVIVARDRGRIMDRTGSKEGGQWLTYAEAGERFGISQEAARQLAKRRNWQRRTPNEPNEPARILVPDDAYVRPKTPVTGGGPPVDQPPTNGHDQAVEQGVRAFEIAISALAAQLERADERARLERERADRLDVALVEVRTAERIATREVAALRTKLDQRRGWSFRRRLWWAIRSHRD
jgi:hypothetical protein